MDSRAHNKGSFARTGCEVEGDSLHASLGQLFNDILGEVIVHKAADSPVSCGQWRCIDIQLRLNMHPLLEYWPLVH